MALAIISYKSIVAANMNPLPASTRDQSCRNNMPKKHNEAGIQYKSGTANSRSQSRSDKTCQTIPNIPNMNMAPNTKTRRIIATGHFPDAMFLLSARFLPRIANL
jgi:hypothetical protein